MKKWFIESYFSTAQYQQKGDLKMNSKSIFATATITNKSENQDSKGQISTNLLNAVLVADGLGSYKYARQASDSVVGSLLKTLGSIKDNSRLDFEKLFKTAKDELIKLSDKTKTDEEKKGTDSLFGTTLLTIVETKHTVKIAYVG
ncbi:MAG: protein phosphatase 2C domain-containing protein, partial [Bacteroidetes bacterium]|nr:protein phosphatase 2C domain-containing protein [Bacteroidota bacterium]